MNTTSRDKTLIIGITAVVTLTITLSLTCSLLVAYFDANKDWVGSLIGSLGNVIGGILGGFIAYFVANHQIRAARLSEEAAERQEAYRISIVLKEEIRNNSLALAPMINSNSVDLNIFKYHLTRESWLYFSSKVAHRLDENLFIKLNTLYRQIQVYQSLTDDQIRTEVDIQLVTQLRLTCEECIRALESFRQNQESL